MRLQIAILAVGLGAAAHALARMPIYVTNEFSNAAIVAIPDSGRATPYPAEIVISNLPGTIAKATVRLSGLYHAFPDDMDVLLVGPTGANVMLMSKAGGGYDLTNAALTFDDAAATNLPDSTAIVSGTYRPTDYEPESALASPAPAGPYGTNLAVFAGLAPTGTWSLYVYDDGTGDSGAISNGWRLTLTLLTGYAPTVSLFCNPAYVDTNSTTAGEASNLVAALTAQGCQVNTFTGITATAWSNAVRTADVLLIPELENGDLAPALSAAAKGIISNFVAGGGWLVVHGQSGVRDESLVNQVFGFALVAGSTAPGYSLLTEAAIDTLFAGGPDYLYQNDGTYAWLKDSLPANALSIYDDTWLNTTVASVPCGQGCIVFLAYDWWNAVPRGTQDGGWDEVLRRAVFGATTPVTPSTTIRYVNAANAAPAYPYATWATAATSIQDAIDAADDGDTVLVTNGVYATGSSLGYPALAQLPTRVAIYKPVTVRSVNGPDVTLIRGQGPVGDGAIRCVYVADGALLTGFTLTNGATFSDANSQYEWERCGGGAWCEPDGVLSNCTLSGNAAYAYGGGAYNGTLNNCTIAGNSATYGGGMIYGTLNNSTLSRNTAAYGGGICNAALNNCVLSGNEANYGGGAFGDWNLACTLNNCTLTGNKAYYLGGGAAYGVLNNCILYYNSAPDAPNGFDCALFYCCTTPDPASYGCITDEPLLASVSHLSSGSPCIGKGSDLSTSERDIDGDVWRTPPSIGCDEVRLGAATGPLRVALDAAYTNVAAGFAVSFVARIDGRTAGSSWSFGDGTMLSNRPYATHAWGATGTFAVVLKAWNDSNPAGVSTTARVQVLSQQVRYVAAGNATPTPPYDTWAKAATRVQDAIDACTQIGGLVLVTNGQYGAGGQTVVGTLPNRAAIARPITVRSVNGPAATAIVGQGPIGDSAVRCAVVGEGAVLAGFTLTNGATRQYGMAADLCAGGVWCVLGGLVTNCTITGNAAYSQGGGAYNGTLNDCSLIGNAANQGGGSCNGQAINCRLSGNTAFDQGGATYDATLINCSVLTNLAFNMGGGVSCGVLSNCVLSGNEAYRYGNFYGGAAYYAVMRNCTLSGNIAPYGGGAAYSTLNDCTVSGNTANYGGGVYVGLLNNCLVRNNFAYYNGGGVLGEWSLTSILNNCTVADNTAYYGSGGGAYGEWALPCELNNCIVYYNSAADSSYNWTGCLLLNSCADPAYGAGNVTALPQFIDRPSGNYRLRLDSPCVDAGLNAAWMAGVSDLDGQPRIRNGTVDMGAYETRLDLTVRMLLQGPYQTNIHRMAAALATHLPLTSPYAADRRTVPRCPSNVVDWVLMELRDTNGNATVSESAFLDRDGRLMATDGSTGLVVNVRPGVALSLGIKHRTHLAALSAQPLLFTNNLTAYDFTTASARFYGGTNGCRQLESGTWGMVAGDADGDGAVLDVDRQIWQTQSDRTGYCRGDFNLDGVVAAADLALWSSNVSRATAVLTNGETILSPALMITPPRRTVAVGAGQSLAAAGATGGVTWAFVRNASGGSLTAQNATGATYQAGAIFNCIDMIEAWDSQGTLCRAPMNVIGADDVARAGRAIVIAGRRSADDPLWPTTDYLADLAYNALRYRGYGKTNLWYLSPLLTQDVDGDGANDISGESTLGNAAFAFTNWAARPGPLFVYMVDHGGDSSGAGYFRLNSSNTLTAATLDQWLDTIQNRYTNDVTVVIDCCQAGSFLDELKYTGTARRIVITACATNQPTYFVAGGRVSFSDAFFGGILQGLDLKVAFELARDAMAIYQSSWIDSNKDGKYQPGVDTAAPLGVVGLTSVAGKDVPRIGSVMGNQALHGATVATLWAGDIASVYPLARVWCLVAPPGQTVDPANPVANLPELDLSFNPVSGRYEGQYDGFTERDPYTVIYYAKDVWESVSPPRQSYVTQARYTEWALLVAAGATTDAHRAQIDGMGRLAYQTLRSRQFANRSIYYLNAAASQDIDRDGTNDVDGLPTLAQVSFAITNWAATTNWGGPANKLTVYLIGDGSNGLLRLNASEVLTATNLDGWLDTYQSSNLQVCTVLDFPGSGSFLPALTPSLLQKRVNIAGARANQNTWWGTTAASFSRYFLGGVFMGQNIRSAFVKARDTVRRMSGRVRQQALLDDNGDGVGNKYDGALALQWHIGSAFVTGAEKPVIATVMPDTLLKGTNALTLWVSDVSAEGGISNVICFVTPPDYNGVGALPQTNLTWNAASSRYQAVYTGFQTGTYACTFYATDNTGEQSTPVQARVFAADAYEPDDDARHAASFAVSGVQIHNFHTSNDTDWVRFYVPSGAVYDIEAAPLAGDVDLKLDLWYQYPNGSWTNLDSVDEEHTGMDPETSWIDFSIDPGLPVGFYYLQASIASNAWLGAGSGYALEIRSAEAGEGAILIAADVLNSAVPLPGAKAIVNRITTQDFVNVTSFMTVLPPGVHTVAVQVAAGYLPLWDLSLPGQETNPASYWFGNPKAVVINPLEYNPAIFQFMPVARINGTVLDAGTSNGVVGAQLAFTARGGILSNTVWDGYPGQASYRSNWVTGAAGSFPTNVWLPVGDWDLTVSRTSYVTRVVTGAVMNLVRGATTNAGTFTVMQDLSTNGVPVSWLIKYGWTNNFTAACLADADNDGQLTWREWVSDTDPTNPASVLRLLAVQPDTNGTRLTWQGGTSVWQYVERARSVTSLQWTAAFTNVSPTPPLTNILDRAGTNPPLFYRIKAER